MRSACLCLCLFFACASTVWSQDQETSCEGEYVLGFSLVNQRGSAPFEGVLGVIDGRSTCDRVRVAAPGDLFTLWPCLISNPTVTRSSGVQSWSIGIAVDHGDVHEISVEGTAADEAPVGLLETGFLRYERIDPTRHEGQRGMAGAVVLSFTEPVSLPTAGTESMLALSVTSDVDSSGGFAVTTVRFAYGLNIGNSPNSNSVTVEGETHACAFASPVELGFGSSAFSRGDVTGDGLLSIGDSIAILHFKFLGIPFGECLSAADVNDSGTINTSDAIQLLSFLFLGGTAPMPPRDCGTDPTPDQLRCRDVLVCE